MKPKDFERLAESIKQAGDIRRGRTKPGRVTEFRSEDVFAIRAQREQTTRRRGQNRGTPDL